MNISKNMAANWKKKASMMAALLACCAMVAGSLAYFTDRVDTKQQFTILASDDSIDIRPDPVVPGPDVDPVDPDEKTPDPDDPKYDPETPDGFQNWLVDLNETALGNLNPGDRIRIYYTISNDGKLAMDARETIVVRTSEPLSEIPELQLNNGVASRDKYTAFTADKPFEVEVSKDRKTLTYKLAPFALKGSLPGAEEVEGVTDLTKEALYNLVFDKTSANKYQNMEVKVDYMIEAKQHTEEDNWAAVANGTVDFGGNQAFPAVPPRS